MEGGVLTTVVLPLALAFIMLGMGLGLTLADFRRVLQYPKAVTIGIVCQMVLLPLIGYGIARAFGMEGGLAVGLMVLAFCPGGVTSNMYSLLARGDVALSITLTAVVSVVTPFTIPFLVQWSMEAFLSTPGAAPIELPIVKTIVTLLAITVVPVGVGMLIKRFWPGFAARADRTVKIASVVILVVIIAGILKKEWANIGPFFAQVGLSTLTLNVSTMVLGFVIAMMAGLRHEERVSIGIEVGIQNGTTGLVVAAMAAAAA
ncbi:MAG: bile acid:sodium symporter family protein, partial [Myxococcales bacterium]|nr:bile acid:sodium symporter family protein [Myxococcales bacterium]